MRKKKAEQHAWTDEEVETLRRDWRGTHQCQHVIAAQLQITPGAVAHQVQRMGLARRHHDPPWTDDDDQLLNELLRQHDLPFTIGRLMGRSTNAVAARARHLRAMTRAPDQPYTIAEAAAILGKDSPWVRGRIKNGAMTVQTGADEPEISPDSLRNFIRKFAGEISGGNTDLAAIVTLMDRERRKQQKSDENFRQTDQKERTLRSAA